MVAKWTYKAVRGRTAGFEDLLNFITDELISSAATVEY
jgi:hypothetical protein